MSSTPTDSDADVDIDGSEVVVASKEEIREVIPFWVYPTRRTRGGGKTLHLPSPGSTCDEAGPCCGATLRRERQWQTADVACYPPDYHPMCVRCRAVYDFGRELPGDRYAELYGGDAE